MELSTNIPIPKSNSPVDYHSKIISFGSCFANEVGKKFDHYKFRQFTNPFGVLFHPLAIEKVIDFALSEKQFTSENLFYHNERWHCFDVHSNLSHPDKEEMIVNLNATLKATRQNILEASHFIITLGTAWVYHHIESNETVANCHKVPQKEFEKRLLSIEEITTSLEFIVAKVKGVNSNIRFIFTISPVRHLKDGFTENQVSKSHLVSALHESLSTLSSTPLGGGVGGGDYYFPSYEIMIDELRDYRFYAADMVHPNSLAINYIWERFGETYFTNQVKKTMTEVETIQKGLAHKPFNTQSDSHQKFLKNLLEKINLLQLEFPHILFK